MTGRCKDHWIVDFGVDTPVDAASLFEAPFEHLLAEVKAERLANNDRGRRENWWRFGRNGADMRRGVEGLARFAVTVRVAKHRAFSWLNAPVSPDSRLLVIARADDTTFGILSSRMHEVWSLAQASMHGVGNDPTYNAKSCFETFPFPEGLTPADTAHQRGETLPSGAVIPLLDTVSASNQVVAPVERAQAAIKNEAKVSKRADAEAIANAAKTLNDRRQAWLNPPEWTHNVPEVIPLGMTTSPYPDRIEPKPGISAADLKALQARTLTNLYNARPAWLTLAHQTLDKAVAHAYGWTDYTEAMTDDDVLGRLLKLNLERHAAQA